MSFKVKIKPKTGSCDARAFALLRHGEQDHGCLKIADHLEDVVENVIKHYNHNVNYWDLDTVVAAAYGHDLLEDTATTYEEIVEELGEPVADLVALLTDKDGRNRMERHLRTYHMIRRDVDATMIKLCDRRHNHARSIKHGEHYVAMYQKEYTYFKFALYTPHKHERLWEELDEQYEEMTRKLTW